MLNIRRPRGTLIVTMRAESPRRLTHGRRKKWQAAGVLLDESIAAGPVDLTVIFGNRRPVELEIGTGKGTFLLARATARPELNFLGVEWARSYAAYAADRCRRARLTNVRILRADATEFVRRGLADGCLWRVHVYFPDPWPKRRHRRRRSLQVFFLQELHRVLQPGGQLLIVTDHWEYSQHIDCALGHVSGFASLPPLGSASTKGELAGTNFERKYRAQRRPVFSIARLKYV